MIEHLSGRELRRILEENGFSFSKSLGQYFLCDELNTAVYDEIIPVSNEDAFAFGKKIGKKEDVLVGISSGAAAFAAFELAKKPENAGKTIVVPLSDIGDRYFSTPLFAE